MRSGRLGLVVCLVLWTACGDEDAPPTDAGLDSGVDAGDAGCVGDECCTEDEECDNGVHCDGVERCVASRCSAGTAVVCEDEIACTTDACDEARNACTFTPVDADDDGHADALCVDGTGDPLGDDCDDDNAARFPGNVEVCDPETSNAAMDEDCDPRTFGEVDLDGDGAVDDRCVNTDAEGVERRGYDCDDDNMARRRGQQEFCDQRDNDCDDIVDEDPGVVAWYADEDEDGVGGSTLVIETCTLQPNLSLRNTDCDDNDAARRPGFPEFCDGVDNNCNDTIDERLTNCATSETQTKQTIDECRNGLHNCAPEAICSDLLDGFSCACAPGYMGDGLTCMDIVECTTSNGGCDPLATCVEGIGAPRTCMCPSGYATTDNGMTCVDIDDCATDNGGCGDATYITCVNTIGAPPTCVDINECATDNGGCGDPMYMTCSDNDQAPPTCADVDECLTDNGGCGDPTYTSCANIMGAAPTCVDINECATNNGGCGNPTYITCTNNNGAPPTCVDINECATNNGGCSAQYATCTNNYAAARTCVDINECATNNGGCHNLATCTNNPSAAPSCACNSGYVGDGYACIANPRHCLALYNAGVRTSGLYTIDPDAGSSSNAFQAYCDMTNQGGGWTLIRRNSGGTSTSVEGLPTASTNRHLSPARMMAIAAVATQVHIRTSGNANDSITSIANSAPIVRLRQGLAMVDPAPSCDVNASSNWTGSAGRVSNLWFSCCPEVNNYPDGVFHACNNIGGMHWTSTMTHWTGSGSSTLEMYFR